MRAATDQTVGKEMSAQFRRDFRWGLENYAFLAERHPGKWVVIHDKQIVAAGLDIAKIREQARRQTGCQELAVFFADDGCTLDAH